MEQIFQTKIYPNQSAKIVVILGLEVAFGKQVYLPIYLDTFPTSGATSEGIYSISVYTVWVHHIYCSHMCDQRAMSLQLMGVQCKKSQDIFDEGIAVNQLRNVGFFLPIFIGMFFHPALLQETVVNFENEN